MPTQLSDGTISWLGGMDTSRKPSELAQIQYSKANNIIIPNSLGGIRARFGIHSCTLEFDVETTKALYRENPILAEGYYVADKEVYLLALVSGCVLQFTKIRNKSYYVENLNYYAQNSDKISNGWIIPVPNGAIVNNGVDYPLHITVNGAKRTDPEKGEIGVGQMGVYLQHRLFYVTQDGKQIYASDFNTPTNFTREGTNIFGFSCPDADEIITAIGKQKSIVGTIEGGNLIWSSTKDIYSTDVRGTRDQWANLGSNVGKTTETVPGFSAVSSYSFESFNTNIYFRSAEYGMADFKQSQYQFVELDSTNSQSIEASYYFDNDTDFMLSQCYTRACNKRLYTTVAPERDERGYIFWNGILSFFPSSVYGNQGSIPRRFESVFTGVRPWCLTCVKEQKKHELFIHSYDMDGVNRLYLMDEDTDYDTNHFGQLLEIEGFIETRSYTFESPKILKKLEKRSYSLNSTPRNINIILFSRPENEGEWTEFWNEEHLICRTRIENNAFFPEPHKPQTRPNVIAADETFSPCFPGSKVYSIQYRIEFKGPLALDSFLVIGHQEPNDLTVSSKETQCETLIYSYRPDYFYNITKPLPIDG